MLRCHRAWIPARRGDLVPALLSRFLQKLTMRIYRLISGRGIAVRNDDLAELPCFVSHSAGAGPGSGLRPAFGRFWTWGRQRKRPARMPGLEVPAEAHLPEGNNFPCSVEIRFKPLKSRPMQWHRALSVLLRSRPGAAPAQHRPGRSSDAHHRNRAMYRRSDHLISADRHVNARV